MLSTIGVFYKIPKNLSATLNYPDPKQNERVESQIFTSDFLDKQSLYSSQLSALTLSAFLLDEVCKSLVSLAISNCFASVNGVIER